MFCGQATHPYPTSMVALKSLPLLLHLLQVETPSAGESFCPCVTGYQQSCAVMPPLTIWSLPTGKHPKGNLEVLEEFKEFIQRKGLLQENVILPEQRGEKMLCSASPPRTLCATHKTATLV